MTIEQLIVLLQNKLQYLNNAKATAQSIGDLDELNRIDQDIITTELTLAQLKLL